MRNGRMIGLALGVWMFAGTLPALDKNDILRLAREGVSDDIIVLVIEKSQTSFELSAGEIVRLKQSGVSDAVLSAMIGRQVGAAAVRSGPALVPAVAPTPVAEELLEGQGTLTLQSELGQDLAVEANAEQKLLYLRPATAADVANRIRAGASSNLNLHTGSWKAFWLGRPESVKVKVREDGSAYLTLRPEGGDGVLAVATWGGEVRESQVLRESSERLRAREAVREAERLRAEAERLRDEAEALRAASEPRVIYRSYIPAYPAPTYVRPLPYWHPPVYVAPPVRYYRPPLFSFSFSSSSHRSHRPHHH